MTQVNLLPPEIRQRAVIRRNTFLVGIAGVALVGLMVLLYLLQAGKLADVNKQVDAQEKTNASLQKQADGLSKYAALKMKADAEGLALKQVFAGEISWSSLLQDISDVMPSDAYLTSMAATTAPAGAGVPSSGGSTVFAGQLTFAGNAYQLVTFPVWLDRIGSIKGIENPFLNSYTEAPTGSGLYGFQSGADLGPDILTPRGARGNQALSEAGTTPGATG
jgi:Tfp pilus assembly protein PilN